MGNAMILSTTLITPSTKLPAILRFLLGHNNINNKETMVFMRHWMQELEPGSREGNAEVISSFSSEAAIITNDSRKITLVTRELDWSVRYALLGVYDRLSNLFFNQH